MSDGVDYIKWWAIGMLAGLVAVVIAEQFWAMVTRRRDEDKAEKRDQQEKEREDREDK